ncbi:hypothetical protein EDF46_1901 [Frondihabitans sp. PhB188]|uniref:hypothetical protein n=1 Tax=Frondihabitans sp. PhB188 TaxID=2485200 RepID=UPI000F4A9189|nr:hypothetical protein [Frondihabitans sp. PhB188]ROQ38274.1 hypothetical protein EDF46_1901 [Frondihabitans sp. PhB188]
MMITALTTSLVAAEEALAPVFAPAPVIALTFGAIFFVLGVVVFSYRNIANKNSATGTSADAHSDAGTGNEYTPLDEFGHADKH